MQETAIENPYGLGALIANGDIIARSILAILLIMSLLTWFIMITKFFDQRRQRKQAIEAEREFWSSSSLTDALNKLKGTSNPFRALAETGKQAYEYHETNKTRLSGAIGTSEWITESLQRTADTVISRMQSGLPVLASVGATAPFVGLLGTVIGILNAFQQIATQKTSGIGAVAGGISEALVTTAFGLLVAIPAVMAFNYFTGRVEAFDVEMDNSSSELVDYFIKQSHKR
jgi:biopolymer transport protein TolQ